MKIVIYILITLIASFFFLHRDGERGRKWLIVIGCTLLTIESGFRHVSVGPDTIVYYQGFQSISNSSWLECFSFIGESLSEVRDPGYTIFVKAFSSIIPSWRFFLVFIAILFFAALGRVLYKYVPTIEGVLFAFVLYLSLFNIVAMSGIRQQITTAISLFVIPLINEKKWTIALPIIALGATIHISLLFVLLFFPFMFFSRRSLLLSLVLAIILIPIIALSARSIVDYMSSFIANDYYSGYAEVENGGSPIVYVILCTFISIFLLFKYKTLYDEQVKFLIPACILMTIFVPLIFLDGTMIRIGQYFTVYMMISLPRVFNKMLMGKAAYVLSIAFLSFMLVTTAPDYYFFWQIVPGFRL